MVITNRRTQQLKRVEKMKYIGVILDEGLKLNEHLYFKCKKMAKKYRFMIRILKAKYYYTNQLLRLT
jgi:hypothetical protein